MRKATLPAFYLSLFLFYVLTAKSQDVATDNEGKPIFTIPNTAKLKPEVALNNIGLEWTPVQFKKVRYYINSGGGKLYTMNKSTTLALNGNILNNEEDVLLINKDINLAPHFEISLNRAIDSLFNPSRINKYYTFSVAVFADRQSFKQYDTVARQLAAEKYKRWSFGGRLSLNLFHKTKSAWAFNLSFQNSVVTDELTSFQDRSSNTVYIDNNIATNGESDGYLNPITPGSNWRFSVAHPIFCGPKFKKMAIVPYYFMKFGDITPKHNAGVLFTFLSDTFRNFDQNPDGTPKKDANYTFETAFSIGLNLISTGSKNRSYVFLSGTITIGKTKTENDKKDPGSKTNNIF